MGTRPFGSALFCIRDDIWNCKVEGLSDDIIIEVTSRKVLTLVFVREGRNVLLGMKKRGFGEGRWNGFGGKVEKGETIEEGAKRELMEESGVTAHSLNHIGNIDFEFENDPVIMEVHVFNTFDFSGCPIETEEMRPQWFNESEIPFSIMWPDDVYWFPHMLAGKKFEAYFFFKGLDVILKQWIKCDENV